MRCPRLQLGAPACACWLDLVSLTAVSDHAGSSSDGGEWTETEDEADEEAEEAGDVVGELGAIGRRNSLRRDSLSEEVRGPEIDSWSPCPFICMVVLTWARFLDHTGGAAGRGQPTPPGLRLRRRARDAGRAGGGGELQGTLAAAAAERGRSGLGSGGGGRRFRRCPLAADAGGGRCSGRGGRRWARGRSSSRAEEEAQPPWPHHLGRCAGQGSALEHVGPGKWRGRAPGSFPRAAAAACARRRSSHRSQRQRC